MAKKKLFIVESPAKIKTIGKFLGDDFRIMSTVGHIMDLPPKKLGVSINGSVELEYEVIPGKEPVIADICKAASGSEEIFLATDPDREGEIIAWLIGGQIEKVLKNKKSMHRITFNEITKSAILEAIEQKTTVGLDKVAAQQARRVLDRWVGYEVSPILWEKITKGLSAGRVQSVALRLVCDREESIRNFKPEEYWTINGIFTYEKDTFEAALTHIGTKKAEIKNQKEADTLVKALPSADYTIDAIEDKKRIKNPVAPFMTSSLQQAAFNRLGFSVKKTMQIAQKLYEGLPLEDESTPVALITYMRTDSLRLSDTAIKQARDYITKKYSKEYLPSSANVYDKTKKGKVQDAHEAIRPIDATLTPEKVQKYLPKDAAKLYTLIWQRCIASQMKPAQYAQRTVTIKGGKYTFKVTGSTLLFDGFLKLYGVDEDEKEQKVVIPQHVKEKESTTLKELLPKQHFTQPQPKYTEASLVKELEKEGIGRPSTYATILSTIQSRAYVTLDTKKRFAPTELGMAVTKMLVENLPEIMDVHFTASMEENLYKIAAGELDKDKLLKGFYKTFKKDLEKFSGKKKKEVQPTEVLCPNCQKSNLVVRFGKNGEFLGCPNFPDCTFTCNFERTEDNKIQCKEAEEPKELDIVCPTCGKHLRQVMGKFGPFIACSGYPECTYIHREIASFTCPNDKGEIIKRRWRGGTMWGCGNYPKCKFAIFGDIEEKPCPQCKSPYLLKKFAKEGKYSLICANKECNYSTDMQ